MAQGKKEAAAKLKYLKRELKDLERSFEKEHGRAPSQADLTDEQRWLPVASVSYIHSFFFFF